jgi:3-oxoacyl-[acyl-carrier-protein] synthase III
MTRSVVLGYGHHVPEIVRTNDYFVARNPFYAYDLYGIRTSEDPITTSHEWILERMGVEQRRIVKDGEFPSDLAIRAGRKVLYHAGVDPSDLEGIVVANVTGPQYPSVAVRVQEALQATNVRYAPDVRSACAGFPYAIDMVNKTILTEGTSKPYLVIAVETLSPYLDLTDKNSPLFGDGAGGVVLGSSRSDDSGVLAFRSLSTPFDGQVDWICEDPQGFLRMPNGRGVLRKAAEGMTSMTQQILSDLGWRKEDVFYFPHQANYRITRNYIRKLDVDSEQVFDNIRWLGNMSSATCPIGLSQAHEQSILTQGQKVVVVSVGSGLSISGFGFIS